MKVKMLGLISMTSICLCLIFFADLLKDEWKPCYTGVEKNWENTEPWSYDAAEGEEMQEPLDDAYIVLDDILTKAASRADFAGYYFNCSGTLTVLVVGPTKESAEEYAKLSDAEFWILEAVYSQNELEEFQSAVLAEKEEYGICGSGFVFQDNAVYFDVLKLPEEVGDLTQLEQLLKSGFSEYPASNAVQCRMAPWTEEEWKAITGEA